MLKYDTHNNLQNTNDASSTDEMCICLRKILFDGALLKGCTAHSRISNNIRNAVEDDFQAFIRRILEGRYLKYITFVYNHFFRAIYMLAYDLRVFPEISHFNGVRYRVRNTPSSPTSEEVHSKDLYRAKKSPLII